MSRLLGDDPRILVTNRTVRATAIGGAVLFGLMAVLTFSGAMETIDRSVLLALRLPDDAATTIGPRWLERAVIQYTALGGYALMGLFAVLAAGMLLVMGKRGFAFVPPVVLVTAIALEQSLKAVFGRERPDFVDHLVETSSLSFPSGHAVVSSAFYLTLGVIAARATHRRSLQRLILGSAVLIAAISGLTRLYLGVHFPSDILAGWALGTAWASFVLLIWPFAAQR